MIIVKMNSVIYHGAHIANVYVVHKVQSGLNLFTKNFEPCVRNEKRKFLLIHRDDDFDCRNSFISVQKQMVRIFFLISTLSRNFNRK